MFTQACFIIKDTQELRDKLKEIGINPYPCIVPKCINYLFVNRGFYSRNEIGYKEEIDSAIDCGTNEDLFLALAALRNDSDYMQYFIAAESDKPMLCTKENIEDHTVWHELYRKMTAEELVDYFNKQNV